MHEGRSAARMKAADARYAVCWYSRGKRPPHGFGSVEGGFPCGEEPDSRSDAAYGTPGAVC